MNTFHCISLLIVISLTHITSPVGQPATDSETQSSAPTERPSNQDYDSAHELMVDFFDLSKRKGTSLEYWAKQLMILIKQKNDSEIDKLRPFLKEFAAAHRTRNALGIGLAFKNHKDAFGEPALAKYVEKKIKKEGIQSLLVALKHRLNKQ